MVSKNKSFHELFIPLSAVNRNTIMHTLSVNVVSIVYVDNYSKSKSLNPSRSYNYTS